MFAGNNGIRMKEFEQAINRDFDEVEFSSPGSEDQASVSVTRVVLLFNWGILDLIFKITVSLILTKLSSSFS